jgi:hypothetical protein
MLPQSIIEARKLAQEFIESVDKLSKNVDEYTFVTGTKDTSAVRRKSMDLTRKLVEVRRPYSGI